MKIHFISGLPRSGSTLLSAIFRQNPRFHAGISSPLHPLYSSLLAQLSAGSEYSVFISDKNRRDLLRGLFTAYYEDRNEKVIFDTNRLWPLKLPSLMQLFPDAKVICCVRPVSWIIDSIERVVRKNAFEPSGIFGFGANGSVYTRAEAMCSADGLIGSSLNALREAFYGEYSDRLVLVPYSKLAAHPKPTIGALYGFIGEDHFGHNFDEVHFDADAFDEKLGTPGLHRVSGKVEYVQRETILPPDLFSFHMNSAALWAEKQQNTRSVLVL